MSHSQGRKGICVRTETIKSHPPCSGEALCPPGSPAQHSLRSKQGPGTISSGLQVCRVPERPSSSSSSCSPWPSALPQMPPGAPIAHNPSRRIQTCWQQLVPSLQTFPAGIMGDKTHPVTSGPTGHGPSTAQPSAQDLCCFTPGQGLNCNLDTL